MHGIRFVVSRGTGGRLIELLQMVLEELRRFSVGGIEDVAARAVAVQTADRLPVGGRSLRLRLFAREVRHDRQILLAQNTQRVLKMLLLLMMMMLMLRRPTTGRLATQSSNF